MRRFILSFVACAGLLAGLGCEKKGERGESEKKENGVQTTVETERSGKEEDKHGEVKVRVRTPAGDYNVDVQR